MFILKTLTAFIQIFSSPKLVSVESHYSVTVPKSFLVAKIKVTGWGAIQVRISNGSSERNERLRFFHRPKEYEIFAPVNSVMIFYIGNLFGMKQFKYIAKPTLDQYPDIQPLFSQEMIGLDGLTGSIHRNLSLLSNIEIQMNSNIFGFKIHNEILKSQIKRCNDGLSKSPLEPNIDSIAIRVVVEKLQVSLLDTKEISKLLDAETELAKMPRSIQL
jgi:hypothetical protein